MKLRSNDIIAAIATPLGTGAISIVRMSGPGAISLADKVFRGSFLLCETPGYTIRHGVIADARNEEIDTVLAAVFRSPHSYTGEDSVEISCHGGSFVTKKILSSLIKAGARQADPGEFTKRAFLNGKMDLAQAEAVADLISAGSERALRNSNAQLSGALGNLIRSIRDELLSICSLLEISLDFSEDDVSIASQGSIEGMLLSSIQKIEVAMATYGVGKVFRDGASVAIVGRPSVGKSSLFNRLLMSDRSIVSDTPGTTRDFLEESVLMNGTLIRLFDTAGLRTPSNEIEAEGISRTMKIIESSDVVLLVLDSTQGDRAENDLGALPAGKVLVVRNKIDLDVSVEASSRSELRVSAATGEGLDELRQHILKAVHGGGSGDELGYFVSSSRHLEALGKCKNMIEQSIASLRSGLTAEFVSMDLRLAVDALAEITGEVTTDDILNAVFARFCIGK